MLARRSGVLCPSLTKTWCSLIREVTVINYHCNTKYVHLIQERKLKNMLARLDG